MSKQDHNQLEDLLRSKIGGVRMAPPASLHDKVAADFSRIRRRRAAFWWFFGALGGVVLLVAAYILWPAPSGTNSVLLSESNVAAAQNAKVGMEPVAGPTGTEAVEESFVSDEVIPDELSNASIIPEPSNTSNATAESQPQSESVVAEAKTIDQSIKEADAPAKASIPTSRKKALARQSQVPIVGSDDPKENSTTLPASATSTMASNETSSNNDALSLFNLPMRTATIPAAVTESIDPKRSYPSQGELPYVDPTDGCPKWIVGASGGFGMSYRTLQSNVHHQLVEHKNQSEHASLSSSAGLYVVGTLLGNSGIKTAFTYLRVGERYHFENDHASHATTNTYEYVNMDLKFNQSLFCNNRLRLDVAAGTKFNLLRNAHSSWLDPNSFEAVAHSNQGEHSPFRQYNLVWSADLTGYYFFSQRGFVGLTIEADRFQNSIYKDAVELEQRPYAFQGYFNIGFRF
jgi:hypothetical protein